METLRGIIEQQYITQLFGEKLNFNRDRHFQKKKLSA